MRNFWIIWTGITLTASVLCLLGCFSPHWLEGHVHVENNKRIPVYLSLKLDLHKTSIGLYRRCAYPVYIDRDPLLRTHKNTIHFPDEGDSPLIRWRVNCGHYRFTQFPHRNWRAALCLLVAGSSLEVFLTLFLILAGINLTILKQRCVIGIFQVIMFIAGLSIITACVLYTLGWANNTEVQQVCGEKSSRFRLGHCRIGWSYFTTIFSGILAWLTAVLPCLRQRSSFRVPESFISPHSCTTHVFANQSSEISSFNDQPMKFISYPVPFVNESASHRLYVPYSVPLKRRRSSMNTQTQTTNISSQLGSETALIGQR